MASGRRKSQVPGNLGAFCNGSCRADIVLFACDANHERHAQQSHRVPVVDSRVHQGASIQLTEEIGLWGGDIRKAELPDYFEVDYVRVYEMSDVTR